MTSPRRRTWKTVDVAFNAIFFVGLVAILLKPTISQEALEEALHVIMPETQELAGEKVGLKLPNGAFAEVTREVGESKESFAARFAEAIQIAKEAPVEE